MLVTTNKLHKVIQTEIGAVPLKSLVRLFMFAMEGQDQKGDIQKGNFFFRSISGKITLEDINLVKKQYCEALKEHGAFVDWQKCIVLNVFEYDA